MDKEKARYKIYPEKASVDVCIATYKRPILLNNLLESLSKQVLEGLTKYRFIIVDNDVRQSAKSVVNSFI